VTALAPLLLIALVAVLSDLALIGTGRLFRAPERIRGGQAQPVPKGIA
jgi:hypothetical protein